MEAATRVLNAAVAADRAGQLDEAVKGYEEGIRVIQAEVLHSAALDVASQAAQAVTRYKQRVAELGLVRKRQQRRDERGLALRYELLRRGRVGAASEVEPVSDAALRGDSSAVDRECRELERRFKELRGPREPQPAQGELEARLRGMRGDGADTAPANASGPSAPPSDASLARDWSGGDGDEGEDADTLAERLIAQARDELRLGVADDGEEEEEGEGTEDPKEDGEGERASRRRQRRRRRGSDSDDSDTSSSSSFSHSSHSLDRDAGTT